MNRLVISALLLLATGIAASPVYAQISGDYNYDNDYHAFFVTGAATVDGDIFGNNVMVGKDNAANFATIPQDVILNVTGAADGTSGAVISGRGNYYPDRKYYVGLNVFGRNQANISGGSVWYVYGWDSSTVNITGGDFDYIFGYDTSTVRMSGATINRSHASNGSTLYISGGEVIQNYVWNNSTLIISGARLSTIDASDNGVVSLRDGIVDGECQGFDFSQWEISGGSMAAPLGYDNSTWYVSGGTVDMAYGYDSSKWFIRGGTVTDIFGFDNSVITITGGTIGTHTIRLSNNSIVNITGSGLSLSSVGAGSDALGSYTDYLLDGTLQGGQSITGVHLFDYNGGLAVGDPDTGAGSVHFLAGASAAPEPASLALIAVAGIGFLTRKRRR